MENMKEVLKKTRKAKHKKPTRVRSKVDDRETSADAISEFLSKSWKFSSPPANSKQSETDTRKVNAFERLMAKKPEPLTQISPKINGLEKKRKNVKKPKNNNKLEVDNDNVTDDSQLDENNETPKSAKLSQVNGMLKFLNGSEPEVYEEKEKSIVGEDSAKRKRTRVIDTPIEPPVDSLPKRRKVKVRHEDLVSPVKDDDTPTYQSGRPRRSCAGNVNYESLMASPDKNTEAPINATRSTRVPRARKKQGDEIETLTIDDDESQEAKSKPVKLAPLFMKKLPKPAIDPAVVEARRNFLLLGLPEDLRNNIDKQKQFEEDVLGNELIAFPLIAHVTQLKSEDNQRFEENSIDKSVVRIKEEDRGEGCEVDEQRVLMCGMLTDCHSQDALSAISEEIRPVERESIETVLLKSLVKKKKEEFESFPTNRCFKQLYWKHQTVKDQEVDGENLLFIDIFKPTKMEEYLVNVSPIRELQKFLLTWNDKAENDDSDDSCSASSSKGINNFVVLSGANGCGKTSSVYALANELNYQVIEINAGARRSGKKMLDNLLEATQSHRVKDKSGKLFTTSEEAESGSHEAKCDGAPGAKSIILIEDAELVFESDDGFVAAIQQLINNSKRPVILTTNNRMCQYLQKFIHHKEIMYDVPKEANHISKYLSLMCLAANYQINAVAIEHLFALNERDLRRTINEIEFFIRSGNSRTASNGGGDLIEFYEQPRRKRSTKSQLNYGDDKTLSTLCFESSITSSTVVLFNKRADGSGDEVSYQQNHLTDEIAEFLSGGCNVVEAHHDLPRSKQKIIER